MSTWAVPRGPRRPRPRLYGRVALRDVARGVGVTAGEEEEEEGGEVTHVGWPFATRAGQTWAQYLGALRANETLPSRPLAADWARGRGRGGGRQAPAGCPPPRTLSTKPLPRAAEGRKGPASGGSRGQWRVEDAQGPHRDQFASEAAGAAPVLRVPPPGAHPRAQAVHGSIGLALVVQKSKELRRWRSEGLADAASLLSAPACRRHGLRSLRRTPSSTPHCLPPREMQGPARRVGPGKRRSAVALPEPAPASHVPAQRCSPCRPTRCSLACDFRSAPRVPAPTRPGPGAAGPA